MTRPFVTEEDYRAPPITIRPPTSPPPPESESTAVTTGSSHPQQQMMFTRAKFSPFEILPPVMCTRRVYVQVAFLLLIALIIFLVRMMSAMRGTFLHYHLESDTDGELIILPTEFAEARGAFCLDGSPPAYYYRQSVVPSVRYWIVHLQSGAWCTTVDECLQRSSTYLGSSLLSKMSQPLEGIMSSDCNTNPDFCMWHMVDLVYCDGSSFLGNRSDPVIVNSKEMYMRGGLVFDALIEYLTTFTPFRDAERIILAGSSAGSLGALIHGDRLRKLMPSTGRLQTVHVVVDGGLFVDIADIAHVHTMANMLKEVFHFHHVRESSALTKCTRTMSVKDEEWQCILPEVFHKHVSSPVYFINSLYDTWFRSQALGIDCSVELCSDLNLREVVSTRIKILRESHEILQSAKNGVFLTSCPAHTVLMKGKFFTIKSLGRSVQQALGAWANQKGSANRNLTEVLEVSEALRKCPSLIL